MNPPFRLGRLHHPNPMGILRSYHTAFFFLHPPTTVLLQVCPSRYLESNEISLSVLLKCGAVLVRMQMILVPISLLRTWLLDGCAHEKLPLFRNLEVDGMGGEVFVTRWASRPEITGSIWMTQTRIFGMDPFHLGPLDRWMKAERLS